MKKLLLSLFIGFIGFSCFSSAITLDNANFPGQYEFQIGSSFRGTRNIKQYYGYSTVGVSCIFSTSNGCSLNDGTDTYTMSANQAYCTDSDDVILNCGSTSQYYYVFLGELFIKQFYPDYTSLECQTEYNLIPINEVTENYCVTNGLCPSNDPCTDLSGVNWSSLYINDIQHISAPLINITIPEEFNWDYTGNDEVFDLSVEGYNVDTEYIAGIINTQNTKPTQNDFNDIINKVLPLFIPGLVIILFIYFVFRFIKKIF